MSHFTVLLSAGPCSVEQLREMTIKDICGRMLPPLEWSGPDESILMRGLVLPPDREQHFDWFTIGGRWRGYFVARRGPSIIPSPVMRDYLAIEAGEMRDPTERMRSEHRTDVVVAGDVDWEAMRSAHMAECADWYDRCEREGLALDDDGNRTTDIPRRAYLDRIGDGYSPATYAICDAMGWRYAPSEETVTALAEWDRTWQEYVSALSSDTLLVLLDCHL